MSASSINPKIPWRRVFAEGMVIAVSILLAFSIDAWGAARSDRIEEKVALLRLRDEFIENRGQLAQIRKGQKQILTAAQRLLSLTAMPTKVAGDEELGKLVWELRDWWSYDPSRGTLNSLISSGRLALIQSVNLRVELASWPDYVEDLKEDERAAFANTQERLLPFLRKRIALRTINPFPEDDSASRFPLELEGLLESREFENHLVIRQLNLTYILLEIDRVDSKIERIQGLIDQRISELGG